MKFTHKNILLLFILSGMANNVLAQLDDLPKHLRAPFQECFEDLDITRGAVDFHLVSRPEIGYLKVEGESAPCGCYCRSEFVSYPTLDDAVYLQSNEKGCSWEKNILGSVDLDQLLPVDFGLSHFDSFQAPKELMNPVLFMNIIIPTQGTETKVKLELIPFGLNVQGDLLYTFHYGESSQFNPGNSYNALPHIIQAISSDKTLELLLAGNFEKISLKDTQSLHQILQESEGDIHSMSQLQEVLIHLKAIYDLYYSIENHELILGWDSTLKRFYVKEKIPVKNIPSFREFILKGVYWGPIC